MWYPIDKDFTLEKARDFLQKDFAKVVKRTKYLYVETKPPENIGYGFFEPILLCFCWCDFLGALYSGDGKSKGGIGSTKRSENFINEILGAVNPSYKAVSGDLVKVYRHGTVHAYAPARFDIRIFDNGEHLKKELDRVIISLRDLLDDLLEGIELFANKLYDSQSLSKGSLGAFNKARKELG